MRELPWFPFFAGDWLLSRTVRRMSLEARAVYIDLLAHQWQGGPLPTEEADLAALVGVDDIIIHRVWSQVSPCFERTDSGLVNQRIEELREEQHEKADKRSSAGKRAAQARWGQ